MSSQTLPDRKSTPALEQNRIGFGRWFGSVGLRHIVGFLAVIFAAFPIVYVISASVSTKNTMTDANNLFATFTWENYAMLGCNP
ncbi:MAG: sugar ABC transporter permease, partial [Propionibacteriaceae bacterium]|nr:sugar ABC transporter permease [Propionibacteriaceae bacterium]